MCRAEVGAGDRPGRRPADHQPVRPLHRVRRRQQHRRAVGVVELPVETQPRQPVLEAIGVVRVLQLHQEVDDRRRRARVLLREGAHLARDRADDVVAQHVPDELAQAQLVRRVGVGVDQADRDPLDPALGDELDLGPGLGVVEGDQRLAATVDPLDDPAAEVPGHERPSLVADTPPPRWVRQRLERAPEVGAIEDVAVAVGGQERDLGDPPGDDGVQACGRGQVEHLGVADADLLRAASTERSLACRSVGTFDTESRPSSMAITSVNVPPTSTPTIRRTCEVTAPPVRGGSNRGGATAPSTPSAGSAGT